MPRGRPRKKPVEAKPIPQTQHAVKLTYEFDRDKDLTGFKLKDLPHWAPKAARCSANASDIVLGKRECDECKQWMYYCDNRETLCEDCNFRLHERNRDLIIQRAKRNNQRPVNPFHLATGMPRSFWPR